ncbi:MAG: coenzyme F420-0:L-glutamate ligase [Sulfolobales archaeon]
MKVFPEYLGVKAFGVKMGVILPGDDIVEEVYKAVRQCFIDGLIDDGDVICVKENIVARAQNNIVSKDEVVKDLRKKLGLGEGSTLGVLFPIASRNRFAPILEGFTRAVTSGKVVIQFSYPRDCVGNQLVPEDLDEVLGKNLMVDEITHEELMKIDFQHPATGVNYIKLYTSIIEKAGAKAQIFLSNNPRKILDYKPDGIVVSCIHERDKVLKKVKEVFNNVITLQEILNDPRDGAWSEWGLLGSNVYSNDLIKLAPREAYDVARKIRKRVLEGIGKEVEVMIYGDGAYLDPATMIYELADPVCSFGHTEGLLKRREGIKYKYFVGMLSSQGRSREEIEQIIENEKKKTYEIDDYSMEGTTPRRLSDVIASLADLVSGSADAGTPVVIVKGFLK